MNDCRADPFRRPFARSAAHGGGVSDFRCRDDARHRAHRAAGHASEHIRAAPLSHDRGPAADGSSFCVPGFGVFATQPLDENTSVQESLLGASLLVCHDSKAFTEASDDGGTPVSAPSTPMLPPSVAPENFMEPFIAPEGVAVFGGCAAPPLMAFSSFNSEASASIGGADQMQPGMSFILPDSPVNVGWEQIQRRFSAKHAAQGVAYAQPAPRAAPALTPHTPRGPPLTLHKRLAPESNGPPALPPGVHVASDASESGAEASPQYFPLSPCAHPSTHRTPAPAEPDGEYDIDAATDQFVLEYRADSEKCAAAREAVGKLSWERAPSCSLAGVFDTPRGGGDTPLRALGGNGVCKTPRSRLSNGADPHSGLQSYPSLGAMLRARDVFGVDAATPRTAWL